MSVDIRYGAFSFLGSNFPIPYVSRETDVIYYTNKHCQITRITLDGLVIGTFAEIDTARNAILNAFSRDFLNLTIVEGGVVRANFATCVIKGVDFEPANYGKASYSIKLECYEEDLFSATFGVLDPSNDYSFSEQENGIVQITHSVSARGFSTSAASAITNAKNFVNSISGYSVQALAPHFVVGAGGAAPGQITDSNVVLTAVNKNIDTATATYSQEETYLVQISNIGPAPLIPGVVSEISSSISTGVNEEFSTIDIDYSIIGHKHSTELDLRNKIPTTLTLLSLAERAIGSQFVNPIPLNYSVDDQASTSKKISIKVSYNTDILEVNQDLAYFDYSVDFSTDHITNITTASLNGEIKAKGSTPNKYVIVSSFCSSIINSPQKLSGYLYEKTNNIYTSAIGSDWPLKPIYESLSVTEDKFKGVISLQASFSNEDFLVGFTKAQYSLDVTPQLAKFSSIAGNNGLGLYGVFDLNAFNMEESSLKLELVASESYKNTPNIFLFQYTTLVGNLEVNAIFDNLIANGQYEKINESSTTGVFPNFYANYSSSYKVQKNGYLF